MIAKERLVPIIQDVFMQYTKAELMAKLEQTGLPFAPIAKPEELFDDPHLNAGDGLVPFTVTDGEYKGHQVKLPALPIEMAGHRFGLHQPVPHAGEHSRSVLEGLGYSDEQVQALLDGKIISEDN